MRRSALVLVAVATLVTACSRDGRALRPPRAGQTQSIVTTSTSTTEVASLDEPAPTVTTASAGVAGRLSLGLPWPDSGTIEPTYTCKGAGIAPRLTWAEVPAAAQELALTVTDDTASALVHWVIAGIDPTLGGLDAGDVPQGAVQAIAASGVKGWTPPCPTAGSTHRFRFTLYALSAPSGLADGADSRTALAAVQRNVLALDVVFGIASA